MQKNNINPNISITFLGTGTSSGVPMVACPCPVCQSTNFKDKRLRSSILIKSKTTTVLIDATPDFRYQMLRAKVTNLDAIVFTHPHKDHIGGLDDVRAFNYFSQKPMPLYCNSLTEAGIKNDFHYAFADLPFAGLPQLQIININTQAFTIGNINFLPIQVMHYKMPVLGFRIGKLAYITDANFISEPEMAKCNGIETLIINTLRKEKHTSHFTLNEAYELGLQLGAKKIYGTHISHQLGKHNEVSKDLPLNMHLAYDSLEINVENC
jgi:phosphoribosyl 1,2-cyclic phosphate phosphodiesterase